MVYFVNVPRDKCWSQISQGDIAAAVDLLEEDKFGEAIYSNHRAHSWDTTKL